MVTEEKGLIFQEDKLPALSRQPEPLVVTPEYVRQTQSSLTQLQDMVKKVLVSGRDYGPPYEGATTDTLYDPGASLIISAFNAYAGHRRVLYFSNEHGKVAIVLEVPIIQRNTGAEVGSGIASCTVSETKYKYRWVREDRLQDWGYTEDDVAAFRTREKWGHTEYQVPNPELEELLNTVVTMASKRAEVDAAKSLPGVGSALRELFDRKKETQKGQQPGRVGAPNDDDSPRWTQFWSSMRTMLGDNFQLKCHQMLGVKSTKDWLKSGKSIDDAIRVISEKLSQQGKASQTQAQSKWDVLRKEDFPDLPTLETIFCQITGKSILDMYHELGVQSRRDMTLLPWEAYLQLKAVFAPTNPDDIGWDDLN